MKIPKKIKIGGHILKIEFVDEEEIDGAAGWKMSTKDTIRIANNMTRTFQEETLFHEILHCINGELTEEQIGFLAASLYQVLKDNNLLK